MNALASSFNVSPILYLLTDWCTTWNNSIWRPRFSEDVTGQSTCWWFIIPADRMLLSIWSVFVSFSHISATAHLIHVISVCSSFFFFFCNYVNRCHWRVGDMTCVGAACKLVTWPQRPFLKKKNYLKRQTFHAITPSWKLWSCRSQSVTRRTQGFAHFKHEVGMLLSPPRATTVSTPAGTPTGV